MSKSNFEPVCTEIKMDFDDLTADIWSEPYCKIIEGAYMMPHTKKGILVRLSKMYEYVDKYLQDHEDEDPAEDLEEHDGEEAYHALIYMKRYADWNADPYNYIRIRILADLFEDIVECCSMTSICTVCRDLMERVQALPDGAQL